MKLEPLVAVSTLSCFGLVLPAVMVTRWPWEALPLVLLPAAHPTPQTMQCDVVLIL
jgi:hypothetical protein